jgi:hypothetical protein
MKPSQLIVAALLLAAGGAQAQLVEPAAAPTLESRLATSIQRQPASPVFYGGSEGLPPADPKAPDYFRPHPKLWAGVAFSPNFALEAKLTDPDYQEGMRFMGHGPRLAEGVAMGRFGSDLDLVGRASVPVDEKLSVFTTYGVAASSRKYHDGDTFSLGPTGSVGAKYKLNRKQTATAEIPFGAGGKRGATLKLGF